VLEAWLRRTIEAFAGRVLAVDLAVALEWGRMAATRPVSTVDGLLAATARVHDLTLVTRDEAAVAGLGARVLNPWRHRTSR
jgi:predicted nucleic acid-binding protein